MAQVFLTHIRPGVAERWEPCRGGNTDGLQLMGFQLYNDVQMVHFQEKLDFEFGIWIFFPGS